VHTDRNGQCGIWMVLPTVVTVREAGCRFRFRGSDTNLIKIHPNLFRFGRHLLRSATHRILRDHSFLVWHEATCAC